MMLSLLSAAGCAETMPAQSPGTEAIAKSRSLSAMAQTLKHDGNMDGALALDHAAYTQNPADSAPLLDEARIFETEGRMDQAKTMLTTYLHVRPASPAAQSELGIADLATGDPAAAARLLAPIARTTDDVRILKNYAVALDLLGQPEQAEAVDRQALRLDPANPVLHGNLALSMASSGQAGLANAEIETAISLPGCPAFEDANAVMLLAYAGRTDIAQHLGDQQFGAAETTTLLARAAAATSATTPAARAAAFGVTDSQAAPPNQSPPNPIRPTTG